MAEQKKIDELVQMFESMYKYYKGWVFAYEYPGVFTYHQMGGPLSVYFTPDFDEVGVVPIQIMNETGETVDTASVRYMHPENVEQDIGAHRLFGLVRPYLEKLDTW